MRARIAIASTLAALAPTLAAAPSYAQTAAAAPSSQASTTRWRAWVGCWEPIGPDGVAPPETKGMRVCVVPAGGPQGVDVVNVVNGRVAERTHVEATGARTPIGREGCTGVESADWSADTLRVYLKAEITCDGVRRTTSGILAFAPNGEWLDVQGVTTGGTSGVHVTRYRTVTDLAGIPADVVAALPKTELAVSTARAAGSAPVAPEAVIDAARHAETAVVEAWLLERGQGFKLDAKDLVAMADAGVPGRVTDLMIALSNPNTFALNRAAREAETLRPNRGQDVVAGRTIPVYVDSYSPFGWGPWGSYSPWYYGYSPYGRYGSPYGGYGYSPYGWYPGSGPIVVITRPSDTETTHPRLVRGQGYTEGRTSTSGGARGDAGSSGSGSSGGSSNAGASSSGSGSSGSSTGRTAKPRVP